jgi:uncharacterized membrane protein
VIVSAAWLGAVIANLFMGISAAATGRAELADAYYAVMDRLVNSLMPAAAIATLATGLLLALTTKWGLLRHHWVLAKLVLAAATVLVGVTTIDAAIQDTIAARAVARSATASDLLLPAILATPTMLATAATLAIAPLSLRVGVTTDRDRRLGGKMWVAGDAEAERGEGSVSAA